jgi:recombination protein RecR
MRRLIEAFSQMPGIGRKTAERLTYYVLRAPKEEALDLAEAVRRVKEDVRHCSACHNITESDPCAICADPRRDRSVVCVVEEPKDLIAIEGSGEFRGLYHVLLGRLSPLDGVDAKDLTVASLVERVRASGVQEVIMATSPNLEGDGTALYVEKQLAPLGVRVTRLARGLPTGGSIEHAAPHILADALLGRRAP